ncbi:hypothetical protein GGS23DRAFT_11267 [Durotheca rogersii]|uniref:uncharacterized protein n=1 Tax=Durotheca rogersii TaxID=419775 RepID=UPI00221F3A6A|nr:uncharacterized protein GGS23DRAFT_11267 [Durotheca rogersii]KAI5868097.1 hypothetical protein GGS23DRAFT_11267 [Durotheca rogersii]
MYLHYQLVTLNVLNRFGICDRGRIMLKAYEDYKTFLIDKDELRRRIRFSRINREALTHTILKCVQVMRANPAECRYGESIIESCAEMMTIGDEDREPEPLRFLNFPSEVRRMIYQYCFHQKAKRGGTNDVYLARKKPSCGCAYFENADSPLERNELALAHTCSRLHEEVMSYFCDAKTLKFSCACVMRKFLEENRMLRGAIRHINFHWCGPAADQSILQLGSLHLKSLTVTISRATTKRITAREEEFRRYFTSKKRGEVALTDALGIDELLSLCGIPNVAVQHPDRLMAPKLLTSDRISLENMLQAKLTLPRKGE